MLMSVSILPPVGYAFNEIASTKASAPAATPEITAFLEEGIHTHLFAIIQSHLESVTR